MFEGENMFRILSKIALVQDSSLHYHRGSRAMLIGCLKSQISVDWDSTMRIFMNLVMQDGTTALGSNFAQELLLQVHTGRGEPTSPFTISVQVGIITP
jgi:hypothetical protein